MALRDWYVDREILLTGVTSELGQALLEKILRSFPTVKVYALTRSRNSLSKEDRIKKILQSPRFERLRQEQPNAGSRVKALEGNLYYDKLGLSKEDQHLLRKVSVMFHAGGPHEAVFEFCQELPGLQVLAAVSSIFRHKGQVAENVQNELLPDAPVALVQIPFVGPAYREPMPGFVEILKGPTALMVGAGQVLGESELEAEVIPIDLAANTLILAAWEMGGAGVKRGPTVYNAATIGCTWGDLINKGGRARRNFPYPTFGIHGMTSSVRLHWILVLLFEWLPSVLCDVIIGLCGGKQRVLQEHERVRNALRPLESISTRPWSVERNRVYLLRERLTPEEQDAFPVTAEIDIESYVLCVAASARKNCANENNVRVIKFVRRFFLLLAGVVLFGVLFYRYHLPAKHRAESLKL